MSTLMVMAGGTGGHVYPAMAVADAFYDRVLAEPDLHAARSLVAAGLHSLPWEGLALSHGEPAIPTRQVSR